MAFESINLNLIPTGDAPVIHAAQYDIDRPLIINMYLGEDTFTPTDLDIELQVRKVDNNIVTAVPDSVDGNTITFLTTEQMTACSGSNLCSLKFTAGDNHIATLHFFLVVQRDVLQGGLTSQSEIHDLAEQIAEIVPEVIGDEYYTAEEVDEKIAEIPTFDPSNYYDKTQLYTKTETNGLLSQKANTSSLSTVAFTGSYDDLSDKPTIPDVSNYYTKSETYNQTEVNNLLSAKADTSSLSAVATSGDYDDLLNKPTIPAAQVQSDWDQSDNTQVDYIKNKPTIPDVSNYYTKSETYSQNEVNTLLSGKQDKAWSYVGGLYAGGPGVDISTYNEISVIIETGVSSGTLIHNFVGLMFKAMFDLYPTIRVAYYGSANYNVSGDITYNSGSISYTQFALNGWDTNIIRIFGR